jgi:hypothetical protein
MLVDCDRCSARALRCDTCVVGLLIGPPDARLEVALSGHVPAQHETARRGVGAGPPVANAEPLLVDPGTADPADFDTAERRALAALAGVGLVPPLRPMEELQGDTNGVYVLTERHSLAG